MRHDELLEEAQRVIRETVEDIAPARLAYLDEVAEQGLDEGLDGAEIMVDAYEAIERAVDDETVLLAADVLYLGAVLLVNA